LQRSALILAAEDGAYELDAKAPCRCSWQHLLLVFLLAVLFTFLCIMSALLFVGLGLKAHPVAAAAAAGALASGALHVGGAARLDDSSRGDNATRVGASCSE
jgi:hypothetical protein